MAGVINVMDGCGLLKQGGRVAIIALMGDGLSLCFFFAFNRRLPRVIPVVASTRWTG